MSDSHSQTIGEAVSMAPEIGAEAPAALAAGAPPLPCLIGSNSDKQSEEEGVSRDVTLRKMLRDAGASGYWWKAVFVLVERVKELAREYGVERLGFLTLTFSDDVQDKREAERRFNNFARRVLDSRFEAWIKVFERGARNNRIHFHLLVVTKEDIRSGFNFEAYRNARSARSLSQRRYWTKIYGATVAAALRAEWVYLRGKNSKDGGACKAYGFGRHELVPIRTTADAVGRYLGKYLAKGLQEPSVRRRERRVSYSHRAWSCSTRFGSVHGVYRKKLMKIANALDFVWSEEEGFADFRYLLGPKWAVYLQKVVQGVRLPLEEYPSLGSAVWDYSQRYGPVTASLLDEDRVFAMAENAPEESLKKALREFARRVWNGTTGSYCSTAGELRELADQRCYPGLPF